MQPPTGKRGTPDTAAPSLVSKNRFKVTVEGRGGGAIVGMNVIFMNHGAVWSVCHAQGARAAAQDRRVPLQGVCHREREGGGGCEREREREREREVGSSVSQQLSVPLSPSLTHTHTYMHT
jgi:hypothetical protein